MTLIDRLSKLDGPDRGVDAEICILFQYGGKNSEGAMNVRTDPEWDDNDLLFEINEEDCCNPIPELTASVDAAIALAERVLPGWKWGIHYYRGLIRAYVSETSPFRPMPVIADHGVPAIALCIALLRAKEASHGND